MATRQSARDAPTLAACRRSPGRRSSRPKSRACSESEAAWRRACAEDDFAAALPGLEQILRLEREVAAIKADQLGTDPYEALLDQYEPGGSVAAIDRLVRRARGFFPDLLDAVLTRPGVSAVAANSYGPFPVERQRRVGTS